MTGEAIAGVGIVPNAFDWLISGRLGACVSPSVGQQAARMLAVGRVSLLINMHEKPDEPELLARLGASSLHLPVPGSCAPTQEQLDLGVRAITEALQRDERVVVHCGAGLGRAGTLLAAYLVSQGCSAEEAISRVRAKRPGSIETLEQEHAVHEFAQRCARDDREGREVRGFI
jgi:atypical dual specificity phosphatase